MRFIWLFLLFVLLLQDVSPKKAKKNKKKKNNISTEDNPIDISYLHGNRSCSGEKFPRVVSRARCRNTQTQSAMAKCFSCVKEGVDSICNDNGFLRAFLTKWQGAFNCHMADNQNVTDEERSSCPLGSECVSNPDSAGHGVCCYGDLAASGASTNGDTVCDNCKNKCDGVTKTCQEFVDLCGRLRYGCKEIATD